jgi:hypothetical protein
MRHRALCLATLSFGLGMSSPAPAQEVLPRAWAPPVAVGGEDVADSQTVIAPLRRLVSAQQRRVGGRTVTETDGATGERTDTDLGGSGMSFYPRVAVSSSGRLAAAFSDGTLLHVYVKEPVGSWHEVGAPHEGQTDYSDGRPLLAFSPLGHLVLAWPRKDFTGGQRVWLADLAPGSDELTEPRALDAAANPSVTQVPRDLAVGPGGDVALAYLQGPGRTFDLTARVAFGQLGGDLGERHVLPGIVARWSWTAPQVDVDAAGRAAIVWHTVPDGFAQDAALGDLHIVLRHTDGTLGGIVDLGQTPNGDPMDLAVSDPGEVLLGFEAAGNLSGGDDGSWGYSLYGYKGVLGSTVLGRVNSPQPLVPWADYPRLVMNRRGDALVVSSECCPDGHGVIRARRRLPGGSFGKPALVAAGELTPAGEGSYYGLMLQDVGLDPVGNAMATWRGFGPAQLGLNASVDGPALDVPLPGVPLGSTLPSIVPASEIERPALPYVPPPYSGLPVTIDARALSHPPATRVPTVRPMSLALSVSAPAVRGVPRTVRLYVACDSSCSVQGSGRLAGARINVRRRVVKGGRVARLTVRLSASARRRARSRLRRARSANVRLRIVAATSAGAHAESTLVVSLIRG